MAKNVNLPKGFVIEDTLPEGFIIEEKGKNITDLISDVLNSPFIPGISPAYTQQGIKNLKMVSPALPTAGAIAGGSLGGIPGAAVGGGLGEVSRQVLNQEPINLKDIGVTAGLSAAGEGVGILAAKGLGAAGKAIAGKFAGRRVAQGKQLTAIGNKIQDGLKFVRKEYGKLIGEQKDIIKAMDKKVDTSTITNWIKGIIKDAKIGKAGSAFSKTDQEALENIAGLLSKKNKPKDLFNIKQKIEDQFLHYSKTSPSLQKVSDATEGVLRTARNNLSDLLTSLDDTNKLRQLNAQFSKVANLYDETASVLGKELNLQGKMTQIGKKIIDGDVGYISLFDDVNSVVPESYKFGDELRKIALRGDIGRSASKVPFVGGALRAGDVLSKGVELGALGATGQPSAIGRTIAQLLAQQLKQ